MIYDANLKSCCEALCVRKMGPGHTVDLVLNLDLLKDTIDVRKSLIYDDEGNQYILSQTTPSIRKYDIGIHSHHASEKTG